MGAEQESIGGLFARLADDASTLIRAEVELYRADALHRLALSQRALIFLGSALFIAQAAFTCLLVMTAIGLASRIGPIAAGLVVSLIALAAAAILARLAAKRLSKAGSNSASGEQS